MPLSFNYHSRFVCDLVSQWRNVHVPPVALCHHITPKDDQVTTLNTPWTPTSEAGVRSPSRPEVGKLVVAYSIAKMHTPEG